ncbi:ABC transporter permease [Geomonas subterranea]|nr:ABC transporter permease [Geomonas subterranea]
MVALWQAFCQAGIVSPIKAPAPSQVLEGMVELALNGMPPGSKLLPHIYYSLARVGWGFSLAVAIGVPLGLTMGWSRRVRSCLEAPLELLRPVPPMAWIPISILWFGIGNKAAAFIIFLGAFFPVLLNTMAGVKSIDPVILDAARTLNAARRTVFFKILIPATVPSIFTGVRIGLGIGWMTLVAAEFTGVREGYGLGYMIMTARDIQRPDLIVAGMCVIGFVGIILDKGLRVVRDRCAAWQ